MVGSTMSAAKLKSPPNFGRPKQIESISINELEELTFGRSYSYTWKTH